MKLEKILENLCYYDKRNPDYLEDVDKPKGRCYCDNCFHGRTPLAEEILRLREK